ncbi:5-carboxymethyl-2-hydroxymuconate delta isomerase [Streptomyces sp. MMG1533]|uniref:5-carboxymethyl-2-hydroxymuconate Delta-isomerase n=1 Tax=Streptomyces sp. MMG1533 TaxID=1415546 RepID=UPI0006AEF9AD|nr:5-carboxymethyl-2-hydroxymuconate Delta-isomerase [Streptomyces sp. MMG1533]KOU59796.1 5-carboxymethyl-2-hydroxymuconate delta isomerase [Streptomyces sp. MMG1533]
MPHITVDYSPGLAEAFDWRPFLRELHPMVIEKAGSTGVCKSLVRPAEEACVGNRDEAGDGRVNFVHVEVGLLPGRSDSLKARLSEDVLALLEKHLHHGDGHEVVSTAEVRDLAHSYQLRHSPAPPRQPRAPSSPESP